MAELVVQGAHESQHVRLPLDEQHPMVLGRGERADLAVPWDLLVSRQHAEVRLTGSGLEVRRMESGRNSIIYQDQECDEFTVRYGEEFQIGKTNFCFERSTVQPNEYSPPPYMARMEMMSSGMFRNANRWLEVLSNLPETITRTKNDEEFAKCVVHMLLLTLPRVDTAAVLQLVELDQGQRDRIRMLCWDGRKTDKSKFLPSRTIIRESLQRGDGLFHIWDSEAPDDASQSDIMYTNSGLFDWTYCVPITQEATWGWCLYMSGFLDSEEKPILEGREELQEELRFVNILAQYIGALRQLRVLENRRKGLSIFFPPAMQASLAQDSSDSILRPRDGEISVLFSQFRETGESELRGDSSSNGLKKLSDRVDHCFRLIGESVFEEEGVMADFQGDAAMSFWGWPVAKADGPLPACRAALAMKRAQLSNPLFQDTRMLCGIAHGAGMAGMIGPDDQCKIGVFGHVVNLGARLKSMARQLKTAILIDAATAKYVKNHLDRSEGRCRKLGRYRPRGMEQATEVYELRLPSNEDPSLSDQHIAEFEGAVDLIFQEQWEPAKKILHSLPADDPCKHFLILMIAIHDYRPPKHWDGVFSLLKK